MYDDLINSLEEHDEFLPAIPGRIAHIDGDFIAYFVSYDDTVSTEDMQQKVDVQVETLMRAARAEKVVLHLTARGSTKGNRYNIAIQKEYQAHRTQEKPPKLEAMRNYMRSAYTSLYNQTREADDSLAHALWEAVQNGNRDKAVLISWDKDLKMCQGLHLDPMTGEFTDVDGFGELWLDDSRHIQGYGWKWFWAQMLMGDNADNIQGLAKQYNEKTGKWKTVGAVAAYNILADCTSNAEAYNRVYLLYKALDGQLFHWKTGLSVTPDEVFQSEAELLWMRRTPHQHDVTYWWKEEYPCKE